MKFIATIILSVLTLAPFGFAQTDPPTDSKFLTIGDVSKVDVKNKSITIDEATSYNIAQLGNPGTTTPANGGRGSGTGGNVPRGGGRGGRRGGGSTAPATGGSRGPFASAPMECKVTVSSKTILKDGDNDIKIDDIRVGDRIQVFSKKGGSKVDAEEILRSPKTNQ
jgi:hypothetical protein